MFHNASEFLFSSVTTSGENYASHTKARGGDAKFHPQRRVRIRVIGELAKDQAQHKQNPFDDRALIERHFVFVHGITPG